MKLLSELLNLNEGMWVIKNKDGKEKRFKDDKSQAAIDWKNSSTPKKPRPEKAKKYSYEWWDDQDGTKPWDKIEYVDDLYRWIKGGIGVIREPDDWTFGGRYEKEVDGVPVAGRKIRLMYMITKDDDLGVEDGEEVEHSETIGIVRDVKNPEKFVFDGFK